MVEGRTSLLPSMKTAHTLILWCASLLAAQAQEAAMPPLTTDKVILLEKVEGRIDHLAIDVAGQRLFVAALGNNTVEVFDLREGKLLKSLPGFAEPQGVLYVPEFNRIFVANGQDGTCRILDGNDFKTIAKIELGEDADNI